MNGASKKRLRRVRIDIEGRVQGVGFRPAVYRLARRLGLAGFARNTSAGVCVEIQGPPAAIKAFISGLQADPPPQAVIESLGEERIQAVPGEKTFRIVKSRRSGDLLAGMPPDLGLCNACRQELFDPGNRRYLYPFINCTDCGPRYTIIKSLPYDRARTSMKHFKMCPECRREFADPADRRFEAQPDACAVCGPRVRLVDCNFKSIAGDPFEQAARMLKAGKILAVKGVGGYHLCCDALNGKAVQTLRRRKNRPHKPFAVMFKSVAAALEYCVVSAEEKNVLTSVPAPVVVLRSKKKSTLKDNISPDTGDIGVFLPYSPLHCILLEQSSPLVMTSGNLCDEPIAISETGLKTIMPAIADAALVHDREILRRCDDSVMKIVPGKLKDAAGPEAHALPLTLNPGQGMATAPHNAGQASLPSAAHGMPCRSSLSGNITIMIRRSRGYVPAPIRLPCSTTPILACGADLKNTICLTRGDRAFLSAHIGDLEELRSFNFLRQSATEFMDLLGIKPRIVAHDMHPDYMATRFALSMRGVKRISVQHHHAHIASCIVEHNLTGKVIALALDGTGYGDDGTIWGGEILVADLKSYRRVGHFKQYRLPGGDASALHPARMAAGIIIAEFGAEAQWIIRKHLPSINDTAAGTIMAMAASGVNSPMTSSAGRLFDAVSALLGFAGEVSYEGQAAVRLQAMADWSVKKHYPYAIMEEQGVLVLSFAPAIRAIITGLENKMPRGEISGRFHNTIVAALSDACVRIRVKTGLGTVTLSGGVFQNDLLVHKLIPALKKNRFDVYINQSVPPNDGGIALGQAAVAAARCAKRGDAGFLFAPARRSCASGAAGGRE